MNKEIKVLYVEDNLEVAKATRDLLWLFFENVDMAYNGQEGYELFTKNKYDLIITDINMPVLNGLDMIERIRKENEDISIVVVSAYDKVDYFTRCIDLNVDGYIFKPINLDQLKKVLNKRIKRITQIKQNLKSAKLVQEYHSALESSTIVSKTDINGIITYANKAFVDISGYKPEELIGQNHNIIRHPDTASGIFEDMWDTILRKEIWKGRIKNKKKNGGYYWVNVVIKPIVDIDGNIIEFIAIRTDITLEMEYRKTLEEKVKSQIQQIREKDKILHYQAQHAAMGEMIDSIAHQWKQPINLIKMNVDILGYDYEDGLLDTEKIKEFQNKVFSQIDHMNNTLEEFRGFLRPDKKITDFNVENTVKSSLFLVKDEFLKHTIETQIIVNKSMLISGIENEFKHVILNLLNNAKDAFIQNNVKNRKITIVIDEKNIQILDNAGGVPKEVIDHIFEANVTTKEHGTGIGLYMTKQIVQKIGGSISVENKDQGACFTISLN